MKPLLDKLKIVNEDIVKKHEWENKHLQETGYYDDLVLDIFIYSHFGIWLEQDQYMLGAFLDLDAILSFGNTLVQASILSTEIPRKSVTEHCNQFTLNYEMNPHFLTIIKYPSALVIQVGLSKSQVIKKCWYKLKR